MSKLDRGYEDYLEGRISEAFWTRTSQEWEAELQTIDREAPDSSNRIRSLRSKQRRF